MEAVAFSVKGGHTSGCCYLHTMAKELEVSDSESSKTSLCQLSHRLSVSVVVGGQPQHAPEQDCRLGAALLVGIGGQQRW